LKRFHVLQISHGYGGPFVKVCNEYVHAFQQHKVTTVFLSGEPGQHVIDGVGGHEVLFLQQAEGTLRGIKLNSMLRMAKLFRQSRFDVVIAHRYKSIYIAGMMSYFFPVPVIIGVAHEHEVFRRVTRRLFVTFWRRKIVLVGVSESVKKNIARYCASLVVQNRLFSLFNAIDIAEEKNLLTKEQARQELGLADNIVIGSIGRQVAKKNYEVFIEAFARLANPNITLLLIGDGPRRNSLEALAKRLGIENQVVFAGYHDNAHRLVRAMDIFVLPSGKEEAFGIVLLEAMLGKVPVIASDAAGPVEVLADAGVTFESGNVAELTMRIEQMIDQSENQKKQLGEAGYQRVTANFSYETFTRALWQLPVLRDLADPVPGSS
jgi:glycosyltransferase involved in cell wall biosynthesis